jgi:hypothetical protein
MIGAVAGRHHVVENPLRDAPLTAGFPLPSAADLKFLHHLPQLGEERPIESSPGSMDLPGPLSEVMGLL